MGNKVEAVELYRPSNGSEGEWFHEQFCYQCSKFPRSQDAKTQCSIFIMANLSSIDEESFPSDWRYVDGSPVCTSFKSREVHNKERREKRKILAGKCHNTFDIFDELNCSTQIAKSNS